MKQEDKVTDLNTIPAHMRSDYETRNDNIKAEVKLCKHCDGTGNEMFSMYRECPKCWGTGKGSL